MYVVSVAHCVGCLFQYHLPNLRKICPQGDGCHGLHDHHLSGGGGMLRHLISVSYTHLSGAARRRMPAATATTQPPATLRRGGGRTAAAGSPAWGRRSSGRRWRRRNDAWSARCTSWKFLCRRATLKRCAGPCGIRTRGTSETTTAACPGAG